jgi:ferredoxin
MHFVCTIDEAKEYIKNESEFWVSNCGCRERKGKCNQSRIDVCLMFHDIPTSGSGKREIKRVDVNSILQEAKEKKLVPRPFRNEDRTRVDGVCFCCNDCCSYFLDADEKSDKGIMIEKTDMASCTDCGSCVDVCFFNARTIQDDKLKIIFDNCYGCGLCIDACPEDSIEMINRNLN